MAEYIYIDDELSFETTLDFTKREMLVNGKGIITKGVVVSMMF